MKRGLFIILTIVALWSLASCGAAPAGDSASTNEGGTLPPAQQEESRSAPDGSDAAEEVTPETPSSEIAMTLTVNGQTFSATLWDSETSRQFAEQLPLTLNMSELNGNEKYFYMEKELPTGAYQPGQISAGDLMLYGNNCLVLFYESFSSGYSYTRLGSVDNPGQLAAALGRGSVNVTFQVS